MKTSVFNTVNEGRCGYTHQFKIDITDTTAAATTKVVTLLTLEAGDIIRDAAFFLSASFTGGATSALTFQLGWSTTAADADGLIEAVSVHAASTPITAGDATGVAFATKRTGLAVTGVTPVEALFTATGANTSVLTAGEVWVYLRVTKLHRL